MPNMIDQKTESFYKALLTMGGKTDEMTVLSRYLQNDEMTKELGLQLCIGIVDNLPESVLQEMSEATDAGTAGSIRLRISAGMIGYVPKGPEKDTSRIFMQAICRRQNKKFRDAVIRNELGEKQLLQIRYALQDGLDMNLIIEMSSRKISAARMQQIREIFIARQESMKKKEEQDNG